MSCRNGSLIALAALALLPGCAALINGPTQDIAVNSDPPGAHCTMMREKAVIANIPQTPAVVRVNRSQADIVVDNRHPERPVLWQDKREPPLLAYADSPARAVIPR